jgi:hypothetical protein
MNENDKLILAEAFEKAFEIIGRNLNEQIDARFDAMDKDSPPVFTEDRIREIAEEEATSAIDNAEVSISSM